MNKSSRFHCFTCRGCFSLWVFPVLLLTFALIGCSTNEHVRAAKTRFDYVPAAIDRGDWEVAYRLMEMALVSDDVALREEAAKTLAQYPEIKHAAFNTFSKESLKDLYSKIGESAWEYESSRLATFERVASPEEYANAKKNLDQVVAEEYARQMSFQGNISSLTTDLKIHQTTQQQAIGYLGRPSRTFEANRILTWAIRVEGQKYLVLREFERNQSGVTHSLVLAFDENLVLSDMALVNILK